MKLTRNFKAQHSNGADFGSELSCHLEIGGFSSLILVLPSGLCIFI